MKKTLLAGLAVVMLAPLVAQASCDTVKADITQKIVANGLPESGFKLDIVPNDQADQAGGDQHDREPTGARRLQRFAGGTERCNAIVDHAPDVAQNCTVPSAYRVERVNTLW